MEASLTNANVIDSIEGNVARDTCDGQWLNLIFAGESFVFCNSASNKLSHAVGQDLDLSIEYLSNPLDIPDIDIPILNNNTLSCPMVDTTKSNSTTTTSYTKRLLKTTSELITAVQGNRRLWFFDRPSCTIVKVLENHVCLCMELVNLKVLH